MCAFECGRYINIKQGDEWFRFLGSHKAKKFIISRKITFLVIELVSIDNQEPFYGQIFLG